MAVRGTGLAGSTDSGIAGLALHAELVVTGTVEAVFVRTLEALASVEVETRWTRSTLSCVNGRAGLAGLFAKNA